PTSQASSPGRCCWPLSLIRCGGPSATRTRTAVNGIRQHAAKAHTAAMARSISARAISGFVRAVRHSAGTPARSNRDRLLVQLSGRNNRNASMTGTSPRASVSDTRVWQLAVLPSAEAYCAATPTECVPFLGIAVSSITSTALLPPTSQLETAPRAWRLLGATFGLSLPLSDRIQTLLTTCVAIFESQVG